MIRVPLVARDQIQIRLFRSKKKKKKRGGGDIMSLVAPLNKSRLGSCYQYSDLDCIDLGFASLLRHLQWPCLDRSSRNASIADSPVVMIQPRSPAHGDILGNR